MDDIEELEDQCNDIKNKLNQHGFKIKNVLKEFTKFDIENEENEKVFKRIKKEIADAIKELTEEKGRLLNLNNSASGLSSELLSTEKKLSDESDDLEERSQYLSKKLKIANEEYDEAEEEMKNTNKMLNEATELYNDAVREYNRRCNLSVWEKLSIIVASTFLMGLPILLLQRLMDENKRKIEMLDVNIARIRKKYENLREARNELKTNSLELERNQQNTKFELFLTKINMGKAEELRENAIEMEKQIVKWTAMLQEVFEKIQKLQKNRGLINALMFGRQKDTIKYEIEQIVRDVSIIYRSERFEIEF